MRFRGTNGYPRSRYFHPEHEKFGGAGEVVHRTENKPKGCTGVRNSVRRGDATPKVIRREQIYDKKVNQYAQCPKRKIAYDAEWKTFL